MQDQPDDLGDAMRHGPSGPFAIHAWLQPCKQTGKEGVFGVNRLRLRHLQCVRQPLLPLRSDTHFHRHCYAERNGNTPACRVETRLDAGFNPPSGTATKTPPRRRQPTRRIPARYATPAGREPNRRQPRTLPPGTAPLAGTARSPAPWPPLLPGQPKCSSKGSQIIT
jgi:hypothetical protein